MGRNAAGESFLRGFFRHHSQSELWLYAQTEAHIQDFTGAARLAGRHEFVRAVDKHNLRSLEQVGLLYYPGPDFAELAWQRALFRDTAWSLCGITHTTASAGAMDAITEILTAPVQPWDALICTSKSVKDHVFRLLQAQSEYLQSRLGIGRVVLPQMPVIPLGIHTTDFEFTAAQKGAARSSLQLDPNTLVVLFMGRLSFHAKAHPLAMYQALQQATLQSAGASGQKVVLVECGWHANEFISKAYAQACALACPDVRVIRLDGRLAADRLTAWASADIFCSLSDNFQETFGIAPIEAMAAGLPVVVSDWDGYKDTVRHGVDGFRIPTLMPASGMGDDLALRHALSVDTYDAYCGHTSSLVSVDIEAATQAFNRLFRSAELRNQLGEAGRARAQTIYDWRTVIAQYEALWSQQKILRTQASQAAPSGQTPKANLRQRWPARLEPFHGFASYPSGVLTPATQLALVDGSAGSSSARLSDYMALSMVNFAKPVIPTELELQSVISQLANGPQSAAECVSKINPARKTFVFRALVWLIKCGILKTA